MSQAKDRELLRRLEMISRVKPSAESTARAMDRARQALLDAAQAPAPESEISTKTRYIQWRPLTQVAVAAMVMAVISIGIVVWKQTLGRPVGGSLAQNLHTLKIDPALANTEQLKLEAKQIQKLALLADTKGLLSLLETALPANQHMIATHLGKLAGVEAVPALSQLAMKWTGPAMGNPFTLAMSKIQTRLDAAQVANVSETSTNTVALTPPAEAAVAGPSQLSGQVTDLTSGSPIPDALVSVSGSSRFETLTDSEGLYSFAELVPKGYYRVKVTAQGYLGLTSLKEMPLVSLSETNNLTQDLQLQKGCMVKLQAIDQSGRPVKDVSVTASWLGSDHDNVVGHRVVTDTDGQSLVGALEASEIEYMVTAMHPDFVPQHASIKCSDPLIDQSLEITLTAGHTVAAYAEYSDHVAAEGVMIIARPEWWRSAMEPPSQVVGVDGSFSLTSIATQTYRLFARFSQANGSSYELEVAQKELPLAQGDLLLLTLPQASPPVTETISGTIQWVNDLKPDHLDVLAYPAAHPNDPATTNQYSQTAFSHELDTFEIENLAPGTYNLSFQGVNVRSVLVTEISTSNETLAVTLEYVPTPRLKGSVQQADSGTPIQNYTLALRKQLSLPNLLMYTDKRLYTMTDNTSGQFDLELPGIGTYQALIQSPGYVPMNRVLEITGDDHALVLNMKQGGTIRGQVVDINGQSISGVSVISTSQTSGSSVGKTITENGHFTLNSVSEGLATLRISHPDHGSLSFTDLDVAEGMTLDLSLITLNIGATIQGYVLDNAGLPVPKTKLIVEDGSQEAPRRLTTVVTDDTGYYQVSGLPSDLCYIYRQNPSAYTGVVRRSLIGDKEVTYDLDFGVGPQVTGLLTDATGTILSNTRLLLSHPVNPGSPLFQSYAQTDSSGAFTFAGIPAGYYGLYRQMPGSTAWTQVTTFNMLHSDTDLGLIPPKTANIRVTLISGSQVITSDWRVLLQQGHALWSPFLKRTDLPESGDSRYLLDHVLPGDYCVVAQKNDSSQSIRLPITVLSDSLDQDLSIELPSGHITLSGPMNNEASQDLILVNQDKTLVMPIREQNGQYTLRDIPSGEYLISNTLLADMAPLETLTLTQDTTALQLPIDTQQWLSLGQGLISVQVAGQDGLPLMSSEAWLTNAAGTLTPFYRSDSELIFIAPDGTYELTVSHDGFEPQSKDVVINSTPQIALYPERMVIPIRLNTK
jgi:hypothetical protein